MIPSTTDGWMDAIRERLPDYCAEWTDLGDADPGMALLRTVAWMLQNASTRMELLPEQVRESFLTFVGETPMPAQAAVATVWFRLSSTHRDGVEIPPATVVSTRPLGDGGPVRFVTETGLTVARARPTRVVWVEGGGEARVRGARTEVVEGWGDGRLVFQDCEPRGRGVMGCDGQLAIQVQFKAPRGVRGARARWVDEMGRDWTPWHRWCRETAEGWVPVEVGEDGALILDEPAGGLATWRGSLEFERGMADQLQRCSMAVVCDAESGSERVVDWQVDAAGAGLVWTLTHVSKIPVGGSLYLVIPDEAGPSTRGGGGLASWTWWVRARHSWMELPPECVVECGSGVRILGPIGESDIGNVQLRCAPWNAPTWGEEELPRLRCVFKYSGTLGLGSSYGEDAPSHPITSLPTLAWQSAATLPPLPGASLWVGGPALLVGIRDVELRLQLGVDGDEARRSVEFHVKVWTSLGWRRVPCPQLSDLKRLDTSDLISVQVSLDLGTDLEARSGPEGVVGGWVRVEVASVPRSVSVIRLYSAELVPSDGRGWQVSVVPVESRLDLSFADRPELDRSWSRKGAGPVVASVRDAAVLGCDPHNDALYIRYDGTLPPGRRHTLSVRGESEVDNGQGPVRWEVLGPGGWRALDVVAPLRPSGVGTLIFGLDRPAGSADGTWIRATWPSGALRPARWTSIGVGAVRVRNAHPNRPERHSGHGLPGQVIRLRRGPIDPTATWAVEVADGGLTTPWRLAPGNRWDGAGPDDPVFVLDAARGQLHFGDGRHGRVLPRGEMNVAVPEVPCVVGRRGNVPPGSISVCDAFADLVDVLQDRPAAGGLDAESGSRWGERGREAWERRDRAVTGADVQELALRACPDARRAWAFGESSGLVKVVLWSPNASSSASLREVEAYLNERAVVGMRFRASWARVKPVDVMVEFVADPGIDPAAIEGPVAAWVAAFLDPVDGGPERRGWAPGQAVSAGDLQRMIRDVPGVRRIERAKLSTGGAGFVRWVEEPPALVASDADAVIAAGVIRVVGRSS